MSYSKNALVRYRIIAKAIGNKHRPYPSKMELKRACEEELFGFSDGKQISDSTIEKDILGLRQEFDAPIEYSKKERGYYFSDVNFSLEKQPLTEDDISAIQVALNTLSQFKNNEIFKQFGFALEKIIDSVSVKSTNQNQEIDKFIQFQQQTTDLGNEYLNPLLSAIKNIKVVFFMYESFISLNKKLRKVTPLLLKEYDNRWYLISFDMVKEKIITYSLDRISELDITKTEGIRPINFNPAIFFKHSIGITVRDDAYPEEVVFVANSTASKYIVSQPFHESQKVINETKDKTTFELFVLITEELIRDFLSYSGELKVLKPIALIQILKARIDKMNENYGTNKN